MRSLPRLLAVPAVGLATLLLGAGPALAVPPFAPTEPVTDQVDALDDDQVQAAIDALRDEDGTQLYVVYVDSFDGLQAGEWADQSFAERGMGAGDVLFAVATEDRLAGYSEGVDRLTGEQIDDVLVSEVEPYLADQDWTGAAVAMAEGLAPGGGGGAVLAVLAGIAVVGGGGYVLTRNRQRRRAAAASAKAAEERAAAEAAARDPHHGTSTQQLTFRASEELLALDEAVKTSELDLAYARSQYGDEPLAGFQEALDESKAELSRAFTVRQQLDDDVPEDEPTQRRMLTELLQLTASARGRLSGQAEAYARLRGLEQSAPQALAALGREADAVAAQVPVAERTLADLAQRYARTAWSAVADNATEARSRIQLAQEVLARGRAELDAGRPAGAVPAVRAAEDALAQSRTLLEAVRRLADELESAGARFDDVRIETEKDIAEARALLERGVDTRGLREQLARAESALAATSGPQRSRPGLPDPLAVVRQLDEADLALEAALELARDDRTQQQARAAAHFQSAFQSAVASVTMAGDFVTTRRGAVGSAARTRLAEAERHLDSAMRLRTADPTGALDAARRADDLAQQALQAAEQDVVRYQSAGYGPGGYGPGYGPGYQRGYGGSGFGAGVAGGVLGGLLLGGLGGGFGGGYGGGDGDFGGGDFGGGDFGDSGGSSF
ncbi:TPM domain-containing protein [Modestobacter sp. URMC 112]